MNGIFALEGRFELLCKGSAVGRRRRLDTYAAAKLAEFSDRYGRLLNNSLPAAGLLALERDLYGWLEGESGQLTTLLQEADRPLRFEVCAANRIPGPAEWRCCGHRGSCWPIRTGSCRRMSALGSVRCGGLAGPQRRLPLINTG